MKKGYYTEDVESPLSGRVVMKNVYWLCKNGDPKQAIFFNGAPQCNKYQQIPERMLDYTKTKTGWSIGIVFFETAYRPQVSF